jgi:hypothetical protein
MKSTDFKDLVVAWLFYIVDFFLCHSTIKTLKTEQGSCNFDHWSCHGSGGYSLASQCWSPGSRPGQSMWDLWSIKWHWDRFPSSSLFFLVNMIPPWPSTPIYYLGPFRGRFSGTVSPPSTWTTTWTNLTPYSCSWWLTDLTVRYNINNFCLWQQFALIIHP